MKKNYGKKPENCSVTFALPKEAVKGAKTVTLVGDFNNWDTEGLQLKKRKDGSFSISRTLPSGTRYQFRFLINGKKWENAWDADDYVCNALGTENSVVAI